jgi:hypothetical protein
LILETIRLAGEICGYENCTDFESVGRGFESLRAHHLTLIASVDCRVLGFPRCSDVFVAMPDSMPKRRLLCFRVDPAEFVSAFGCTQFVIRPRVASVRFYEFRLFSATSWVRSCILCSALRPVFSPLRPRTADSIRAWLRCFRWEWCGTAPMIFRCARACSIFKDQPGNMRFAHSPASTPREYTISLGLMAWAWAKVFHLQGKLLDEGL